MRAGWPARSAPPSMNLPGAVSGVRQRQPGDGAGHADRQRRIPRFVRIGLAAGVEEAVAGDRGRRGLAIVDRGLDVARRRDGSPCSRRRRYCRRADRSPPARSRSPPRHRLRCRPSTGSRRRCGPRAPPARPPCRAAPRPARYWRCSWERPRAARGPARPAGRDRSGRRGRRAAPCARCCKAQLP